MAYFPNGTAGEVLDAQCADCPIDSESHCPVLFVQLNYNYKQQGNKQLKDAMNRLIADDGTCQMRKAMMTRVVDRVDACASCDALVDLVHIGDIAVCLRCVERAKCNRILAGMDT